MRTFIISLFIVMLSPLACYSGDIKAIKTNSSFEEVAHIDQLDYIKINEPPTLSATPKNLRKQYVMEFRGRNTTTGAYTVWSNTFTDYDTKIMNSTLGEDGYYYLQDNTGKLFKTGQDLTPVYKMIDNTNAQVNTNTNNIETNRQNIQTNANNIEINRQNIDRNTQSIQTMNRRMNSYGRDITRLNNRVNDLEHNMYSGLATVTALTSLHPNPRSTAPIELSIGTGIFRDSVAGAVGIFAHPTENLMIQGGFSFGDDESYAGYVGITIGLGRKVENK